MLKAKTDNRTLTGIILALIAAIIWSGNFIVARGISAKIPPISLAFFRWGTATLILTPFAFNRFLREFNVSRRHFIYLMLVAITGIALFNTFVYVAGQSTTAINMALIGTTSTPIFVVLIASVFLKEQISRFKIVGMLICLGGILLLLSGGSFLKLQQFRFSTGDLWMLAAGLCFAIYSVLVRKKPGGFSSLGYLYVVFLLGALLLLPFYLYERSISDNISWDFRLFGVILFLGLGTSVLAFYCWNFAIQQIGAGNTALFGNLIPVFASIEAIWILNEQMSSVHIISLVLVLSGILIANYQTFQQFRQ